MEMKKYLLTAALAVVVSGAFVSCHDDEIAPMTIDQKKLAFEEAFVSYYGQPDPNHTWGFGTTEKSLTRSVDVNGNMWVSRPEVTAEEAAAVYAWVNKPKTQIPSESYYETSPVHWKNFFVTQVWGKNDNANDNNAKYTDYNNGNVFGGEKMNHLQISKDPTRLGTDGVLGTNNGESAINSNWDHANNFNASQNRDWDGNTMFVDWGTENFAYHNSTDSRYHDKWIIVDGDYIVDSKGVRHTGQYYVCFDFIARNPESYTVVYDAGGQSHNISGAWKSDGIIGKTTTDGQTVDSSWRYGHVVEGNKIVDANEYYTDWIVRLVEAQPKNQPTVPKVKISESTGKIKKEIFTKTTAIKGGRVMCEDIASYSYDRKDFDYNDVVFDAIIYENQYVLVTSTLDNSGNVTNVSAPELNYTQEDGMPDPSHTSHHANIRLMAAGGTIPLQLKANGHNFEVHELFEVSPTVMVNTLHEEESGEVVNGAVVASHDPVDLTVDGSTDIEGVENLQDIEIAVKYSQASAKIDAIPGRASAKILTPLGTRWAKERTELSTVYTHFSDSVKDEDATENSVWNTNVVISGMYDDLQGLTMPNPVISSTSIWEKEYSSGSATREVNATNTLMATPVGTKIYDYTASALGYLYEGSTVNTSTATIAAGSKIRIYGVSIDNWEVTCNNQTKSQSNESSYATNGYVEFDVTNDLNSSLAITGKNFTITYVTIVGGSNPSDNDNSNSYWSSTTYSSQELISTADLKSSGIVKDKAATIKITGTAHNWGGPGWSVKIYAAYANWIAKVEKSSQNNPELGQFDSNLNGSISISIDSNIVNDILNSEGIRIEFNLSECSKVEIFQ